MICNGWYINDTFIPFADSRQGQPNGVATLNETGQEVRQETEAPAIYANTTRWEEGSNELISRHVTRAILPILDVD